MPTTRKRVTRKFYDFSLPDWQLRYLKTGEKPREGEVNGFAVLNFCYSYEAGLTFLKIRDHVLPGTFPYAEKNFERWSQWRQVREALEEKEKSESDETD